MERNQPQSQNKDQKFQPGGYNPPSHTAFAHNPTIPSSQFADLVQTRTTLAPQISRWQALDACGNRLVASITFLIVVLFSLSQISVAEPLDQAESKPSEPTRSGLAIVQAGVQDSEDAPFAASSYQFFPGEYVYFEFQVSGFAVKTEAYEVKRVSLSYEVAAMDSRDVPLAIGQSGNISVEISPEDKNWMPKRRASFLLPSHIASGEYHIRVQVKDLVGKTETSRDIPFQVGGVKIQPADSITVENWRFLRNENDRTPLQLPAYRAGDTIFIRFEIAGYKLGAHNDYDVAYGFKVLRPDNTTFLDVPQVAELKSDGFYPAQFVPGIFNITTSKDTSAGPYVVVVEVRDLLANKTSEIRQTFQIE